MYKNAFNERANRALDLLELICQARQVGGFAEFIYFPENDTRIMTLGSAINFHLLKDQQPAIIASMKARELLINKAGATPQRTPNEGRFYTGYPGAFRPPQYPELIGAFSGLPGTHDLLKTLLALYYILIDQKMDFHHAGTEYSSQEAYEHAVAVLRQRHGDEYVVSADLSEDNPAYHMRTYAGVYDRNGLLAYMREAQLFPTNPLANGERHEHIDVAVFLPEQFFDIMGGWLHYASETMVVWPDGAALFEYEIKQFGNSRPGPVGLISVLDIKRNFRFSIMVRHLEDQNWIPPGLPHQKRAAIAV